MLRHRLRRALGKFYIPLVKWYLKREREYVRNGISINVKPGVFHPGLFYSTQMLLNYLDNFNLENKSFLELGAGSGLISIAAARKNANVTATDINRKALESTRRNAEQNGQKIEVIYSDLFDKIPRQVFDYILINPPFYKRTAVREEDFAWFAGERLEYFGRLFYSIGDYITPESKVVMVLSEDCDLDGIQKLAAKNGFVLSEKQRKMRMLEWLMIYELIPLN